MLGGSLYDTMYLDAWYRGLKRADREIVALDFLLNIPLKNETAILNQAREHVPLEVGSRGVGGDEEDEEVMLDLLDSPSPGPAAAIVLDLNSAEG